MARVLLLAQVPVRLHRIRIRIFHPNPNPNPNQNQNQNQNQMNWVRTCLIIFTNINLLYIIINY